MSVIIAVSLIVEYLFFFFHDFNKNKSHLTPRFVIRIMAGATGVTLVIMEMLGAYPPESRYLVLDIMAAVEILLLYPCSFEKAGKSLWAVIALDGAIAISFVFSLFVSSRSFSFRSEREFFSYIVILTVFAAYFVAVVIKRLGGIRMFFRNIAVWHNLEDYSRFIYSMVYLAMVGLSLCSIILPGDAGEIMVYSCLAMYMLLYAILYQKDLTGRTFLLPEMTEQKVKNIIKGNLRTSFIDKAEEDKKMNNLYNRVMIYMNEKKPFLDPDFHMEDMAEEMYSNKLYLSRTINILSGRNFRQFINYHRIQYAISLFKKDPRLKVGEVATMSGFHSSVSFNMAFKVNMGKTPTEWLGEHTFER